MKKYTRKDIQDLLRRANEAGGYNFELSPPVPLKKIRAFEQKFQIKLPEEYVYFLSEISNGGAGPDYGLYSLNTLYDECCKKQLPNKETIFDNSLTLEKWNEFMKELDAIDDDDLYDKKEQELYQGILIIGTQGCTYDNLLICSGSEKGNIVFIDWNLEVNRMPLFTCMSFWEWYIGYFEDIIAGMDVTYYGYYKRGSEQKLMDDYEKAGDYDYKIPNLDTLYRYHHLSQDTIERLYNKQDYETDNRRLAIILKHNWELGMKLFNRYIEGEHISAAIDVINRLPEDIQPRYFHRALEILNQNLECNQNELLKYLGNQKQTKTIDLIPFIQQHLNDSRLLYRAFMAIHECDDLINYEDFFIRWMYDIDNDDLVNDILRYAIVSEKPSQSLIEAFHYLLDKYPDNHDIHSTVKRKMK